MKLTITTLVIVEGSYIQGIFHSLEEHPGNPYQRARPKGLQRLPGKDDPRTYHK